MTIKSQGGIFRRNPTFNDVEVDGTLTVGGNAVPDASTLLVDGDIGTSVQGYDADTTKNDTANTFTQNQTVNMSADGAAITFRKSGSLSGTIGTDTTRLYVASDNGASGNGLYFGSNYISPCDKSGVLTDGITDLGFSVRRFKDIYLTGNVIVASGSGIDFSATAGTGTSELFSDYEEGSFTPVVEGATTAGTATYPRQGGLYTKIGNRVFVVIALVYNTHTGTGNTRITGLPYTVRNTDANRVFIPFYADNLTITGVPIAQFGLGQTYINVKALENGSDSNLTIDAAATLYITGSYEV